MNRQENMTTRDSYWGYVNHNASKKLLRYIQTTKVKINLHVFAGWSGPSLSVNICKLSDETFLPKLRPYQLLKNGFGNDNRHY